MHVGSLFTGIGGFDLGLERAGMHVSWQCELDDYCRRVLAKHWPGVPCYGDIRELRGSDLKPVDVLCGGFPCQDISSAGKGAGLAGARSGLWAEFHRLIGELRPRYVIVENVAMLRSRGLGRLLGEMAALGYDAEWDCIPACAVGAPHRRDRVWVVAYPRDPGRVRPLADAIGQRGTVGREAGHVAGPSRAPEADGEQLQRRRYAVDHCGTDVADASGVGQRESHHAPCAESRQGTREGAGRGSERERSIGWSPAWLTEPDVGRVANGVPARMDRLRGLGNALVPQIAEHIGRRILEWELTCSAS